MMRGRTRRSEERRRKAEADQRSDPAPATDAKASGSADEDGGAAETDAAAPDATRPGADAAEAPVETLEDVKAKWLRALADAENARKRARADVDDAQRFGSTQLLTSLLPVLDNLQRALAAPPADLDPQFLEGLRLIEQQWLGVLAAHGVRPVPAEIGAPFDPNSQRALLEQPTDEHPPGAVVAEIARCYTLHDRLLREGQVVVARAPDAGAPPPAADDANAAGGATPDEGTGPDDDAPSAD